MGEKDIGAVHPRGAKCTRVGDGGIPGKARRCLGPVALGLLWRRAGCRGSPDGRWVLAGAELVV